MTEPSTGSISLKQELLKKRTILSFALSMVLIYFFLSRASLDDIAEHLAKADPLLILLAFVAHYLSYFIRGKRWLWMMDREKFTGNTIDLSKIIFLFQSVDCILPAKLGDIYGAHLMKINFAVTRSFALGSIFLWRVIDFVVVMAMAAISGYILFGNKLPPEFILTMKAAALVTVVLLTGVWLFVRYHRKIGERFTSGRIKAIIDLFRQGLRVNWRYMPWITTSTVIIWFMEALRFFLITRTMGVELSGVTIVFITLFATLLTAVPFTPSGLGAVELGMLNLLAFVGVENSLAYPLIIWDRLIAHWSQIIFAFIFVTFGRSGNLRIWTADGEENL